MVTWTQELEQEKHADTTSCINAKIDAVLHQCLMILYINPVILVSHSVTCYVLLTADSIDLLTVSVYLPLAKESFR